MDAENERRRKQREQIQRQQAEAGNDPNLAQIDYLYDFSDVFANPQQAGKFDLDAQQYGRPYDIADIVAMGEENAPQSTEEINEETLLQLIKSADMNPELEETSDSSNVVDLFSVDELEKMGITSPYATEPTESPDDTTKRLLQLYNKAAYRGGLIRGNGDR